MYYFLTVVEGLARRKAVCPSTMVYFSTTGYCYRFVHDKNLNWDQASAFCQSLDDDGHLMDIQSEDEQNVAANLTGKNVYVKVPR